MARILVVIGTLFISSTVFANPYDDAIKTVRVISYSSYVRLLPFGKSHSNRSIPAFVMSDFTSDSREKARVLICAGQHGDELDPVISVLALCKSMIAGKNADLLQKCLIIVVPMANPDGIAAGKRLNSVDVDINRDWIHLTTCETRYIHEMIKNWKPHLLIDVHQWNEPSFTPGNAIEIPSCNTGSHRDAMIAAARRAGDCASVNLIECHPTSGKNLFHRRYGSLGYASFLLETQNGEDFAERDRIYRSAILTLIRSVASNSGGRYVMSPASMEFKPALVEVYLEPTPAKKQTSYFYGAGMLGIACIILACLMRPFAQKDKSSWSRRYIVCAVDPDMPSERFSHKHTGCPITSRSRVNRRLRAKYAPVDEKRDKPERENHDNTLDRPVTTADIRAIFRETASTL